MPAPTTTPQKKSTSPNGTHALPKKWSRVVLHSVKPQVDGGRWPIKRTVGEAVEVVAGIIVDGHDKVAAELIYQHEDSKAQTVPLKLRYNDEYVGRFTVSELGRYTYKVRTWLDAFGTWQDQFQRRVDGGEAKQVLAVELLDGAALLKEAARKAKGNDRKALTKYATRFENGEIDAALDDEVVRLARTYDPKEGAVESTTLEVAVDPVLARFGAWYEFFPRSAGDTPGQHGTLDDAAKRLPRIKEMGFDIVYFPPIHPIGVEFRKGKDNHPTAQEGEPGSPYAIGGALEDGTLGGHKSVHPDLGGMPAFERFMKKANALGLQVALDIAFNASPDHPYLHDHPEWFRQRADGTIRYAENPPKKYQDIYPFDFESEAAPDLWYELKSIFEFWIEKGVKIFRVDNPHTKPFAFWEWCLADLCQQHPDLIFLAEAFAKPKTMYTLAKLGYNNSYTYFTWRNTKEELTSYAEELFHTEVAEFFRPNFWPNTPDILTDYLVHGGRPAHVVRFVLATTLSSVYGIYGPPYEHVDNRQHPDREEYADNEKYEIRTWNWRDPNSLQGLMKRVNRIRREHEALQYMRNIRFHPIDNPQILAYTKETNDDLILVIVNLDPYHTQAGWLHLPLHDLGIDAHQPYDVHDLLGGERYYWHGASNYVELNPHVVPAHIFHIQRHHRTERDFPTYR